MNPEEDTIFLCVWLLYYANIFADSQMKKRRYRRMDINGFNVVLEKFSFDLKLKKKQLNSTVAHAWQRDSLITLQLINILNPYGSKLFFRLNGQMWLMVKLSAELAI